MPWSPPMKPRPLCQQCQLKPVKDLRCKFCSTACAGDAKKVQRPLCAFCHERPVKRSHEKHCSRSCAAFDRPDGLVRLQKGYQRSQVTQRVQYFERVNRFLKVELAPVLALVPEPLKDAVYVELMKFGGTVNRVAHRRGYRCCRNRVYQGRSA